MVLYGYPCTMYLEEYHVLWISYMVCIHGASIQLFCFGRTTHQLTPGWLKSAAEESARLAAWQLAAAHQLVLIW